MNIIDYLRQIICILDGIISLIIWQFFDPWIFFGESDRKCAICHSLYRSRHCRKYHFCSILQHDRARCVVGRSFWCDIWISRCSCSNIFILQRTTTEIRWIWNLSNDRRKSVSWIPEWNNRQCSSYRRMYCWIYLSMLLYVLGSLIAAHKQGRSV